MKKNIVFISFVIVSSISINAQTSWMPQVSGTNYELTSVFFIRNTGYTVGGNGQTNQNAVFKTINGGLNWTKIITTKQFYHIFFTDVNTGYAIDFDGFLKTVDGGTSWTRVFSNNGLTKYNFMNSIFFTNANVGYCVGGFDGLQGTILKTVDGGINWVEQTSGVIKSLNSVYFINPDTGYAVGNDNTILKTVNGGTLWTQQNVQTSYLNSVCFIGNTGYAVGYNGKILKTTNGGTNWTFQNSGTTNELNSVYFIDVKTGYAVGGRDTIINGLLVPNKQTILKTNNGGITWTAKLSGDSNNLYSVCIADSNTAYAVGRNGLIIKTTSVGASTFNNYSEFNQKLKIYPNPTKGKFTVIASGINKDFQILIFNIEGQEIQNQYIHNEVNVKMDLSLLPKGVYFIRLWNNDFVRVEKIVVQ